MPTERERIVKDKGHYYTYLDGLCKDTKPKQWMTPAMAMNLRQSFRELSDKTLEDVIVICQEWLDSYYFRNPHV